MPTAKFPPQPPARRQGRQSPDSGTDTLQPARLREFQSIGFLLGALVSRISARSDVELARWNITGVQFGVCRMIHAGLGRTAAELCRCYGYDSGAMARILRSLEQKGLVRRERVADDQRQARLRLTEAGEHLLGETVPCMESLFAIYVSEFSSTELQHFRLDLERIYCGVTGTEPVIPAGRRRE
ncbi:MAG: winged helix-turn-helix transcriptional regulator [Proteobacteria bacterium]|nr:winged helix-turn-helix transcriptional regulator [Pseudomonadota bacterium]HQR03847.1 MarR family winged helix-turn-helix transcriptional regulator [Rhodocyclaceae bacterium]